MLNLECTSKRVAGKMLGRTVAVAVLATASLAAIPAAQARPRVGVSINISVPPRIPVREVHRYEPYYVGRVFYHPHHEWRRVYSFPVETRGGVVYEPYVYDEGRVVCRDFIPGRELGYGAIVIEGRGHYDPRWTRRHRGHNAYRDRGWGHRGHGRDRWDRDRNDHERSDSRSDRHGRGRRHRR